MAETVITALVIALLLIIIFATVYAVHKTRRKKTPAMPVFRRNSKYYVSKRSNSNGQLPRLDSGPKVGRDPNRADNGGLRKPEIEEELTQRSPSDVYEPYVSQRKKFESAKSPMGAESSMLESSSATGTLNSTDKHTVTAAAYRNRCDVTLLANKTDGLSQLEQQLVIAGVQEETVAQTPCPSVEEKSVAQVRSRDTLLSLLDKPDSKNRCDVTSLEEAGVVDPSLAISESKVKKSSAGYVNVRAEDISASEAKKAVCDVAPLSQSLAAKNHGINDQLEKVAAGSDPTELGKDRRCDIVPFPSTGKFPKENSQPNIDRSYSDPVRPDSRKSSLSNTSTTDVAPLIKKDDGKKKVTRKINLREPMNAKPTVDGQTNLAFSEQKTHSFRDSTMDAGNNAPDKIARIPSDREINMPSSRNTSIENASTISYLPSTEIQRNNSKGAFNLIKKSGTLTSSTASTPRVSKIQVPPRAPKKIVQSSKKTTVPSSFQLSQPNVPPIALALPSFTGSPGLTEEYVIITNPVYESSSSIHKTPVSSTLTLAAETQRRQGEQPTSSAKACGELPPENDAILSESPSKNYLTKAKDLLSEVASSMMNGEKSEPRSNSAVSKTVRIVENQDHSSPVESREKLTRF